MPNFKNITNLPVAESADGLNLIVSDNGSAKQIAASAVGAQADFSVTDKNSPAFIKNKPVAVQSDWAENDEKKPAFIKNKPHRELVYEWNFEADEDPENCVWELSENVNEDISWLATLSEDSGFEIEISQYGYGDNWNEDMGEYLERVYPEVYSTSTANEKSYYLRFQNDIIMSCYIGGRSIEDYLNNWKNGYYENWSTVYAYNKVHYDSDYTPSIVNNGGCIEVYTDDGGPLKSVKIYKVYH